MQNENIVRADDHIADLIKNLTRSYSSGFKDDEEKDKIIERINKLRASMNPIINQY
jgi:UDP-N-acetyl-D-mannosaminuronic acid transferase (WecB/TagA/CpsF family)